LVSSKRRPLWREGFDRAERLLGGRLEELVGTRAFNDLLVLAFRGQNMVYGLFERQTRAVLHFWNMPTRSDVVRMRQQVSALTAEVQKLADRLEEAQGPPAAARTDAARRSGAARKRAKS
jgi:hypothetical protein